VAGWRRFTGAKIRAASPFEHIFLVTLADSAAQYLPEKTSYDRYTYEALLSSSTQRAAVIAARVIVAQFKYDEKASMPDRPSRPAMMPDGRVCSGGIAGQLSA